MYFVWNHKDKKGKVHILAPGEAMSWHTHETDNPACPGQITHWIDALCKTQVFRFLDSPIKKRVHKNEFSFSDVFPGGRELCGACLEGHLTPHFTDVRERMRAKIEENRWLMISNGFIQ